MKTLDKMKQLTESTTDTQLSEKLGLSMRTVGTWRNRGFVPEKVMREWSIKFDKPLEWFTSDVTNEPSEFVLVPRYNVEGSAGGGSLVDREEVLEYLSFRKEWIKNSLRIGENALAVISVKGDSMEPRLRDGDVVLLDMSSKLVEDNAIYALQFNGGLSIKRVQRFMSGAIEIISDNKTYKPESLTPDQAESVKVVGRVVWAGGKV
jgi:phage repressor protein C with HTH and peptisase S24 domain